MKPVQSTLQKWLAENKNFQENYAKIKAEVLQDPDIKEFLLHHPQISDKEINRSLIKLYEYKTQSKQCDRCKSLQDCPNMLKGYSPILQVEGGEIHLSYEKCHTRIAYEKEQQQQKLIQSLYMPKDILQASIQDIDGSERGAAIQALFGFLKQLKSGLPRKGLYLHGKFGVGKTYLLGALANELKKAKH